MAKILLDEHFFMESGDPDYLDRVVNFIERYLRAKIVFFKSPQVKGFNQLNYYTAKRKKYFKRGLCEDREEANEETDGNYNELEFSSAFIGQIKAISREELIVFLSNKYHEKNIKKIDEVYIINHISEETKSNIADFISRRCNFINMDNIICPTKNNPFPNNTLSGDYDKVKTRKEMGKNVKEREAIYLEIGEEVAKRNLYNYDGHVSKRNKSEKKIRKIYSFKSGKEKLYFSIDIEHGAAEICDKKGKHVDEYNFSSIAQNKTDPVKHSIIV